MQTKFNEVVDMVYSLPQNEKIELCELLEKNIIESRREEIYNDFLEAKEDHKKGVLKSGNSIEEIKKLLK